MSLVQGTILGVAPLRADPGSHLCGHPNKHKRARARQIGRCKNRVRNDSGYRYCREHRKWRELWAQLRGTEFTRKYNRRLVEDQQDRLVAHETARIPTQRDAPSAPPVVPPTPGPMREHGSRTDPRDGVVRKITEEEPSAVRLEMAVREARTIADPGWRRRAVERAEAALGPTLHRQALSAPGVCDDLARIANALSRAKAKAEHEVARVIAPLIPLLRQPRISELVAKQFAKQLIAPAASHVAAMVHALRGYGVLICVLDGRDLGRCRCLWPLARHEIEQKIKNDVRLVVRHGLDRLDLDVRPPAVP